MTEYSVVGKSFPQVNSRVKATGAAGYTVDMKLPGMLYGKILRSPLPHARIVNIDTSQAEKLPGVKAVITGKDILMVKHGNMRLRPELLDQYFLAIDKVRYVGDEVAAVAAIDEDIAEEALDLIKVDYEELPAVFDVEEASKEGAPRIHDHAERNIAVIERLEYGDVEKGFRESDYIREDRFTTQAQQHVPMEPHACVATFDPSGSRLTIWTSTQSPYNVQCELAATLGMREGEVRVIRPLVGGGWGNKWEVYPNEFCSALLSKKTGRPVKIVYTRPEVFMSRVRPRMIVQLRTGVKKDGTLMASEYRATLDSGGYVACSPVTIRITAFQYIIPYRFPNYKYLGHIVYTNTVPSGAMRGHGGISVGFSRESHMDMIAEELGIDPVELRLKNATQPGDEHGRFTKVGSCGLSECIQKAAHGVGWSEKRGKSPEGRGVGIGCYGFASGTLWNIFNASVPISEVMAKANADGTVGLYTQAVDSGQGSDTVLPQIVAEELGLSLDDVRIIASDTLTAPVELGNWSSRTTMQAGNAAKQAAADIKRQIFDIVATKLDLRIHDELEARDRRVYVKGNPKKGMSFAEAIQAAQRAKNGAPLIGRGVFSPRGLGPIGTPAWGFGAHAVEVEVDKETGQVKVLKVTAAHDVGRAINPLSVEGQVEGSVHMALGYALTEDLATVGGEVANPSFTDYKILSPLDMPQVESIAVETHDPNGPFGAKESGEGITIPTAPAVANAVYDAIGVRIKDLPITPQKVLKALKEKGKAPKKPSK